MNDAARLIFDSVPFGEGDLYAELAKKASELAGIRILPGDWDTQNLPDHLTMRYEILGPEGNVLGAGRVLDALRPVAAERHEDRLWKKAKEAWEKAGITSWNFGDLPERIEIGADALGLLQYAYPALTDEEGSVAIRLLSSPAEAREHSRKGLLRLYRHVFSAELKSLGKELSIPPEFAAGTFFMGKLPKASAALHDYILRELFGLHQPVFPDRSRFEETVQSLTGRLAARTRQVLAEVLQVIKEREETRLVLARFRRMAGNNGAVLERLKLIEADMEALAPGDFLDRSRGERVRQVPRYLKALRIRAERAYAAPEKDKAKAQQSCLSKPGTRKCAGKSAPACRPKSICSWMNSCS